MLPPMRRLRLVLLLIVTCLPLNAAAQGAIGLLCVAKSGKITAREKCASGETAATLSQLSEKGVVGDAGPAGPNGAPGREVAFVSHGATIVEQQGVDLTQPCPAGKVVVGGGCYSGSQVVVVNRSYPFEPQDGSPQEWRCSFVPRAASGSPQSPLITYAVCIDG